jgi:hypothetical protein
MKVAENNEMNIPVKGDLKLLTLCHEFDKNWSKNGPNMNRKLNIYSYPNLEMIVVMGSHRRCAPFSLNIIMKQ